MRAIAIRLQQHLAQSKVRLQDALTVATQYANELPGVNTGQTTIPTQYFSSLSIHLPPLLDSVSEMVPDWQNIPAEAPIPA